MLKVGFLGSSSLDGFETYKQDLKEIIEFLFDCDENLMIVSGGYQGLMEEVCKLAIQIKNERNLVLVGRYKLNILGILFDGYQNDPQNANIDYTVNKPNVYNDLIISASTIGERAQNLVSLPDIVIALPGRTGTLHEILHFIEDAKYGRNYDTSEFRKLLIHPYWKEDVFRYLRDKNILNKENYNYLKFWSNKLKEKEHRKEYIIEIINTKSKSDEKSISEDEEAEPNYNRKKYSFDIQSLNVGVSLIPRKAEFQKLINSFNLLFKGKYSEFKEINYLIGFDIVILDTKEKNLVELTTIGTQKYIDILGKFLEANESILLNEEVLKNNFNKFRCKNLENLSPQKNSNDLKYYKFPEKKYTPSSKSTFFDWVKCLSENQLGKSIVWLTVPALENRYIISAFVSFEILIPKLLEEQLKNILTGFLYNQTLTNLHDRLTVELSKQATRAAISQVMARNMSHNLGSHVLIKIASNYKIGGNQYRPLIEFIQKRMEFIANGTFALFQSTYSLLDEILSSYTVSSNRIELLIENISGNENIKSENIEFEIDNTNIDKLYPVNIPNGTLGFQALHILIENIIRNSVKHNNEYPMTKINGQPEIRLKYSIKITNDNEFKDYYKVCVSDNFETLNASVDTGGLNTKLDEEILKHGSLRKGSWGLLEMKICAAYLSGLPVEFIDLANDITKKAIDVNGIKQVFPPALGITKDEAHNLIHTFYLQKPKIAALSNNVFKEDKANGIELVTDREVFNQGGSKHQFAVFQSEEEARHHQEKTNQTSIFFNESSIIIKIDEKKLWEKYENQKYWNLLNVEMIFKDSEFSPKENCKYILFDDHDSWLKNKAENKALLISRSSQILYYEYVPGNSPTNELIKPQGSPLINDIVQRAKIFEITFSKVIVLDERIQKNLKDELGIDSFKNPMYSNLFIPPLSGATILDKPDNKGIIEWARSSIGFRDDRKLNYLVVHRSLIGKEKLDIERLQAELNPEYIVFVSGGGTPPNLLEGEYYLPFDVLNSCIGTKPSKYALVSVLKSLRKNISK